MPKCWDQRIALIAIVAFAGWLFVGLPLLYSPGERRMIDLGTAPQWLTAFIAGGALLAAAISITSQREIARKRAATDFFLKTEMDHETLESHKKYIAALDELASSLETNGQMQASFEGSDGYWEIRDYLNLHELMAVGIRREVFDDRVCYDFWQGEMRLAFRNAMPLIKFVQAQPGKAGTYSEMLKVAEDWENKAKQGTYI
jgi:hypothetical protein